MRGTTLAVAVAMTVAVVFAASAQDRTEQADQSSPGQMLSGQTQNEEGPDTRDEAGEQTSPMSPGAAADDPEGTAEAESQPALSSARIARIKVAVRRILETQQAAWNRGDIRLYMQGYARTEDLRFLSGADIRRGWEDTLLRYLDRYGDRGAMGRLIFSDLVVKVLSERFALVHGRWTLVRENDRPEGLFTLLFEEREEGWRIIHDHTSSAAQ